MGTKTTTEPYNHLYMTDLEEHLNRLGLSQYLPSLLAEGFETWETVLDITESDLNSLNFKLGHRRKLQRAIAEFRSQLPGGPLLPNLGNANNSAYANYQSDSDSASESKKAESNISVTTGHPKRKYRRHPKPDENAPGRPPSAYVIFSNQVRESLKGQALSFTEMAKIVGEKWQVLPAPEKEACERQANAAKEKYYSEMAEYKRTPQFETYQKYLEEFKAKHAGPDKEGKRLKLESDTNRSTRSNSHEPMDRIHNKRVSSVQSDFAPISSQHASDFSPSPSSSRPPGGSHHPGTSVSPAAIYSLSQVNSPRMSDHYPPLSASPRSATVPKETFFDPRERQPDPYTPLSSSLYGHPQPHHQPPRHQQPPLPATATGPPIFPYGARYHYTTDLPSRQSFRESTRLPAMRHEDTIMSSDSSGRRSSREAAHLPPSLTHEDSTLSSDSSGLSGGVIPSLELPVLPLDTQKASRLLPQPIPSSGPTGYFDRHRPLPPPAHPPSVQQRDLEHHPTSSLAALLRAGEMATAADARDAKREHSSSLSLRGSEVGS
ncbi:hypothetical protein GQ43DRAFT_472412 [Delitschia confertaspora ATCC 74209]|uniref:HMG box domain-containing protein n=1 Tax=Delitschia confertaspora ATCC 74209 TaxID=1513339 RepID=A0A9P4JM53_9PLEO|nr:hypothetical protein GQ43DRAFT_472412 [Delitschia confertaspora ATCC 74209]